MRTTIPTKEGITLRVKFNHRPRVVVRGDGGGLVGQAGSRLLAELAERSVRDCTNNGVNPDQPADGLDE